jgi:gliding motility-associated-like protein
MVFSFAVNAQPYPSIKGTFTASEIAGCKPLTITFNADNCASNCGFGYNGDPSNTVSFINTASHTFTESGVYKVVLVRKNTGELDEITITVYDNTPPTFVASRCQNSVTVKISDNIFPTYLIDYNSESTSTKVRPNLTDGYTFAAAGMKTISVRGKYLGCSASSRTLNVGAPMSPVVINKLIVLDNSSIQLDFNYDADVLYGVQMSRNGSAYQQIKTVINQGTDITDNLRADEESYYCFRLYNACTNTYSNTICSTDFDITVSDNKISWDWITSNTGDFSTEITKSNSLPIVSPANPGSDTDVECGSEYCYALIKNYNNGAQSISLTKCGVAFSTTTPDAIENVSSQWLTNESVAFQWQVPDPFTGSEYQIFKQNGNVFQLTSTVNDTTFTDNSAPTCYQISYTDVCGNESPRSKTICPIVLSGVLQKDNDIDLNWTSYEGWKDGVVLQYELEKNGTVFQTFPQTELQYTDFERDLTVQTYTYVIKAYPPAGVVIPVSISNTITIIKNPNIFHPSAFTPNGDALNDIFNVYGQYIDEFEMNIFNRWGELMYTTKDLELGWDGTYKGTQMPEGTYTFVARMKDLAGRTFEESGSILLLKRGK